MLLNLLLHMYKGSSFISIILFIMHPLRLLNHLEGSHLGPFYCNLKWNQQSQVTMSVLHLVMTQCLWMNSTKWIQALLWRWQQHQRSILFGTAISGGWWTSAEGVKPDPYQTSWELTAVLGKFLLTIIEHMHGIGKVSKLDQWASHKLSNFHHHWWAKMAALLLAYYNTTALLNSSGACISAKSIDQVSSFLVHHPLLMASQTRLIFNVFVTFTKVLESIFCSIIIIITKG